MCMATGALLLWAVRAARGVSTSLNCTQLTPHATPLERFRNCSVNIDNGYVNLVCNILVGLWQQHDYNSANPETVMMEQLYTSDEPVGGETQEHRNVCLSLRSIKIRKWSSFPMENTQQYDRILTPEESSLEPFGIYFPLLLLIRQMTIKRTVGEPPQAALLMCNATCADTSCCFEVYGYVDHYQYNFTSSKIFFWNIHSFMPDVLNVTFAHTVKNIPHTLFNHVAINPIKHLIFYKCNFDSINKTNIPYIESLERLDFFQTPIQKVHPHVFKLNPNLTHSSFIGTKLPGIPEAIFHLRRLNTLDMSNTDKRPGAEFQYCPHSCQRNSTVKQLIFSGTYICTLPSRAFCGFPLLKSLELANCHISQLLGSPFECLENLSHLTMPSNQIRLFDGEHMKGLKNLIFLNLSKNRIAQFQGPEIFSTLVSLRNLILFHNNIKDLELGAVEYVPIEQLNLGHNMISKLNPPLFTRMGKLETLLLELNGLPGLSEDMLHDIGHVKNVNLSWNPWNCSDCQLKNLLSVLEKHPSQCTNCLLCEEPEEDKGKFVVEAPLNEDACGPPDYFRVYGVPALLSILMISLVAYTVYRNRWYFMYILLFLKVAVKGRRRQAQAGRFLWDAFLSYHASDAEWVRDELLPKLESAPMRFRLCVHDRDFIPGLPITENICRAIAQSRVSLFLLSREFCRSRWCMFELSLAQHRLFEDDRHDSMLFIKKNDVDVSEMSSTLAYLIKTRTYVQLPADASNESLNNFFWLQVQAGLEN